MTGPIKVIDIELSLPVTDMGGLDKYPSVQALVRLHGRPLGYAALPVTGGFSSATDIIEAIREGLGCRLVREGFAPSLSYRLTSEGWLIDEIPAAPSMEDGGLFPPVTVAICTRDRPQYLSTCLKAIERLTYPRLEVLLVDNSPHNDAAERLIKRKFPGVQYIVEPRPGLDWARNRAIKEARSDIIAFTDDDVVVDPGWVTALSRAFADDPDVMAATGLVVPYELETKAQILFEAYGGFGKGFERRRFSPRDGTSHRTWSHLAAGDLGTGANMAFRRSVFDRIGGFDPALDTGTATGGGGDLEIFFRVIQEGYTLVYEPNAIVRHIHRRKYSELKTQIRSWGTAFIAYLVRSAIAYPAARFRISCFAMRWLVGRHLIRILRNPTGPKRIPVDLMLTELHGSLAGFFVYQRASRDAKRIKADLGPMGWHIQTPRD
jgi:GT2 family glycosyltransferase